MKRTFLLAGVLALIFSNPARALERAPLVLGLGEQRLLRLPGLTRYSLGSGCVRALAPKNSTKEALLLKAVQPGHADLWVFKADGESEYRRIRVEKALSADLPPALERGLGHLEEAEVILAGAGVVLRGEIRNAREVARIRALAEGFSKEVRDETEPSENLLVESMERLKGWARSTPYASSLAIERQGKRIFVRGALERPAYRAEAEKRVRQLDPSAIVELESLGDSAPTVHFRVFLLELQKNRRRSLGLAWPAVQEGAFRVTTAGSLIQDAVGLDLALHTLEGEGSVRVLSNPELVVRAPGEAELFAGGELPIRTKTNFTANVIWRKYGLTLRLKIAQTAGDRVRLDVFTEVSHLDPDLKQDEIPSIQANRMNTQVDARFGTPLLLSGLLQEGTREQARGLPMLRSIPILGKLFGSEDYLNERSELVAILLPSSTPPSPGLSMNRLREAWETDARLTPRGPVPLAREWLDPREERAIRASPDWPWNAFGGNRP